MTLFLAVVLLRINSVRTERNGEASYKAKVVQVCRAQSAHARKIEVDEAVRLTVHEPQRVHQCQCPKLSKGVTYRVGVDIPPKVSSALWDMEVPKKFYVKEATDC